MQKLSCPDFLLCVAAEYAAQPTNHFTFISILPLMWYSLLERQVKPMSCPRGRKKGTAKAFRDLSLCSAKVFGQHKRD